MRQLQAFSKFSPASTSNTSSKQEPAGLPGMKYCLVTAGFSLLMPLPLLAGPEKPGNEKPNVLFILVDDLGYSDLGCYGSRFYETPCLDKLANEGIRFTDAYAACPVSSPTRASIMTGKYPVKTGITDWIPGRQASSSGSANDRLIALPFKNELALEELTLAELLKKNGYRTMISGKWHLGETPEFWPENQGFDINKGGFSKGSPVKNNTSNGFFSPYGNPRLPDGPEGEYLTDRQTDEAIKFIEENRENPFFIYLSYYAVHNPMQAKDEMIKRFRTKADSMQLDINGTFTRDRSWIRSSMSENFRERTVQSNPVYAAMLYSVDENLDKLFSRLRELGLYENTLIVFTSDNGGLSTSEGSPTCNAPLRAGKGWLYEGGIRVPLIIRMPGKKLAGTVSTVQVSSIDFLPTIADLTGSEGIKADIDGISILPLLKGARIAPRPLFWHYPHYSNHGVEPGSAVILGQYKLIDNFERDRRELYDLSADLSETKDISAELPAKTSELYSLLQQWREKTGARMMIQNPAWNENGSE